VSVFISLRSLLFSAFRLEQEVQGADGAPECAAEETIGLVVPEATVKVVATEAAEETAEVDSAKVAGTDEAAFCWLSAVVVVGADDVTVTG